jgi:hypothetical protein
MNAIPADNPPDDGAQLDLHTTPDTVSPSAETLFPTETEIYLLPSGEVIVADLPAELDAAISTIGSRG